MKNASTPAIANNPTTPPTVAPAITPASFEPPPPCFPVGPAAALELEAPLPPLPPGLCARPVGEVESGGAELEELLGVGALVTDCRIATAMGESVQNMLV